MNYFPYQNFIEPTIRFCEANVGNYIQQPANAWSNLFFIIIGLYILKITWGKSTLVSFGWISILIGLFSFVYHATYTFGGQLLDLGSMFLFSGLLIVLNIKRLKNYNESYIFPTTILIAIISTLLVIAFKTINGFNIGIPIFVLEVIIALLLEGKIYHTKRSDYKLNNLIIAFLLLIVGQIVWYLDYLRLWCNPSYFHYINGHSIWHLLSGLALYQTFRFYSRLKSF